MYSLINSKKYLNCSHRKGVLQRTMNLLTKSVTLELEAIKEAGTWKDERIITSSQSPKIILRNGLEVLNFCSNNYLGLSENPKIINAAKLAMDKYGVGVSSARFICGTQDIHVALEKKIAQYHGREDAMLYPTCFEANGGIFETLLTADDAVISDQLNHASIIDGIRLCKAKRLRYKHRDMEDLENKLKESMSSRIRLIATDGVFSMDGTIAPLPKILELAKKYNAFTFIDDCHGTAIFGETGRGTEEYFNVQGKIDIINSTFGKALGGSIGGYTTGSKELISLLRQRSRPYLFSSSLPPPIVGLVSKALDLITKSTEYLDRLKKNTTLFRTRMKEAGFIITGDDHPICPIMIGDAKLTSKFADMMIDLGIYVIGFSYPVVPKDKARVRVQISAAHSEEDIEYAIDAFVRVGRELGIIN